MANSVSLDGSFVRFKPDVGQHYSVHREYWRQMTLCGAASVVTGMADNYGNNIPPEEESDFVRPVKAGGIPNYAGPGVPFWVVPDTGGITRGLLHVIRRAEYCRDVIALVSEKSPREFIRYLEERHYDYLVCGKEKADLAKAFDWLVEKYGVETMMVDAGPTLNRVLLEQGLIDEISLLVHPVLVGTSSDKLLSQLTGATSGIQLEWLDCSKLANGVVLLRYRPVRT